MYVLQKQKEFGSVRRKIGSSGREKLTPEIKKQIYEFVELNPRLTSVEILEKLKNLFRLSIVPKTIRNFLKKAGYCNRIAWKKPLLSKKNVLKRLEFAHEMLSETLGFWDNVIFSDEVKFNLFGNDAQQRVWRKTGERYFNKNLSLTVKFGGGSLMVWGCFSSAGVGNLCFIEGIMDRFQYIEILKKNLKTSAVKMNMNQFIFQQDNDPKHTSKLVQLYFEKENITKLPWPSQSPDLNPIENLWSHIKTKLSKGTKSVAQLKEEILSLWDSIPVSFCKKLIANMNKRLIEVIKVKGGHTKY